MFRAVAGCDLPESDPWIKSSLHAPLFLRITTPLRCYCRLSQDLQQFNDFFIEKEEECIIRTQALEEQLANAQPGTNMGKLRSAFVDLHGEASSHTPIRIKALYHLLSAVMSAASSCPALELCTA